MIFRDARAVNLTIPMMNEPAVLNAAPPLKLLWHGPLDDKTYRLTMEVTNAETTCTLILTQADPKPTMWLTYDVDSETTYPMLRMTQYAYSGAADNVVTMAKVRVTAPLIAFPPNSAVILDVDFAMPAGIPEQFRLLGPNIAMECGATGQIDYSSPLNGRKMLQALAASRVAQLEKSTP